MSGSEQRLHHGRMRSRGWRSVLDLRYAIHSIVPAVTFLTTALTRVLCFCVVGSLATQHSGRENFAALPPGVERIEYK